jgi:hypothetical protein
VTGTVTLRAGLFAFGNASVDAVIATLGSCPCHSGFDVLYQNELRTIVVNEKLEALQFGG